MKKVRFGVVGTNFITDWVIAGAREDERFELAAVCSRTRERGEEFAAKHSIPHVFTSLDEMASSDVVDAIYIASPNYMHCSQATLCMDRGKHVLCEKPMASNAREAAEMIASSQRNGVALMEAMKSTLSPNFRAVRDNLHRIGTPRRYFASFCQYSSRYDKFKEGIVLNAFRPELSNGAMMDIGVYTIYPLVALFGAPQSVSAQGVVLSSGADGQGAVNMQYEGMNATVLYSKIANSHLPAEIEGEDGNILIDRIQTPTDVRFYPRQAPASGQEKRVDGEPIGTADSHNEYYHEIREFIDLILSGRCESEINSHATSLATMQVIDEVRRQLGVRYPADEA
ncbi:MAG: Gfo/Idh/MocA family oxidoreductase [Rikenellaceae bacterium]|nr:Gfo/Idh/MocA family oxidoreductase [Rikenellaceae bacterium]